MINQARPGLYEAKGTLAYVSSIAGWMANKVEEKKKVGIANLL